MDQVTIRKAKIEDLSNIQKLNQMLFQKEQKEYDSKYNINWPYEEEGAEYFTKELKDDDRIVFIAEDKNQPVGYLAASGENDAKYIGQMKIAELDNMYVLDKYRGRKIGSRLVKEFIEWAKKIDAKRVVVTASCGNIKGINFYKQNGFCDFDLGLKMDL